MIGELFVLVLLSLAVLFWVVIGIMVFVALARNIDFKGKSFKKVLKQIGCMFCGILFYGAFCVFIIRLALPSIELSIIRIPAYWEGKHLIPADDEEVYFCTGEKSECYHYDEYCKGLDNCSGMVVKKECSDAEDYGYRPCHRCYMVDKKYYNKKH